MYINTNNLSSGCVVCLSTSTVKPVLRGQLWDKENWYFKTADLLLEVQLI